MFTGNELMDLKNAFEAVSQGEEYVNMLSLKTLFGEMGIFPTDDMLNELLKSCGKIGEHDEISFELFARSVALLLEENADKGSTSSQQADQAEVEGDQNVDDYYGEYYPEGYEPNLDDQEAQSYYEEDTK
jgi:hypothetical protein